jgi:hypothetical protein
MHLIWCYFTGLFTSDRIIALATVIYALVTIVMYLAIRSQAKAAHRQADKIEDQLREMQVAGKKTEEMIGVMRETAKRELRAYITVLIGGGWFQDRQNNTKFQGTPTIHNAGRTPAYKVSYNIRGAILPTNIPQSFEFPSLPKERLGESIIGPGQSVVIAVGGTVDDFIPDQDVEYVKRGVGTRTFYVWGIVNYEDIWGDWHETEFCQSLIWLSPDDKVFGFYTPGRNRAN